MAISRRLSTNSLLILQPDQRSRKIPGIERLEVVDGLADADVMDRQAIARGDGDQDAAAGGAVELGHDQAGDAGALAEYVDLVEGVLASGSVEGQKDRVGRGRIELADDPDDLLELRHQLF